MKSFQSAQDTIERLNSLVLDLQEGLYGLKTFDSTSEINSYCDDIDIEIIMGVESAIKHLDNLKVELLQKTREYREDLIARVSPDEFKYFEDDYTNLTEEVDQFIKKCSSFMENDAQTVELSSSEFIQQSQKEKDSIMKTIRDIGIDMKKSAFCHRFMKFKMNWLFLLEHDHIGTLAFSDDDNESILVEQDSFMPVEEHPILEFKTEGCYKQALFLNSGNLALLVHRGVYIKEFKNKRDICRLTNNSGSMIDSIEELLNGCIAGGDETGCISIWRILEVRPMKTFKAHSKEVSYIKALRNGNIASTSYDVVKIWKLSLKLEPTLLVTLEKHSRIDHPLSELSNGYLVILYRDFENSSIRIWSPSDGRMVRHIETGIGKTYGFCLLSNDRVALGNTTHIQIFDLQKGLPCRVFMAEKTVTELIQLPTGHLLVVYMSRLNDIRIINPNSGKLIQKISGNFGNIQFLVMSKGCKELIIGSFDTSVKIWSLRV